MYKSFRAPAQYLQEPDVLNDAAPEMSDLAGETALVVGGSTALSATESALRDACLEAGVEIGTVVEGVSRCSRHRIEACTATGREHGADVVVGVGGGHALDTAKAVSIELDAEMVSVPTVASTDAPCSAIAALYREDDGAYEGIVQRRSNPELVLVDTKLIAEAPVHFLRDGMADAFATRFEAEAVKANASARTIAGGRPTNTGLRLARQCYDNLVDYGTDALAATYQDAVTPELEVVVETNTLLSGVGFECGGLAAAHAYQEGFTRAGVDASHGTVVGFSTIAELVLEDRDPKVLDDALALYHDLGMETTLEELGADDRSTIEEIAEHACADDTPMSNEPVNVTPESATDALVVADELVRSY